MINVGRLWRTLWCGKSTGGFLTCFQKCHGWPRAGSHMYWCWKCGIPQWLRHWTGWIFHSQNLPSSKPLAKQCLVWVQFLSFECVKSSYKSVILSSVSSYFFQWTYKVTLKLARFQQDYQQDYQQDWWIIARTLYILSEFSTSSTVLSNFLSSMLLWLGSGFPVAEQ